MFILNTSLLVVGNNTHIINPKVIMQTMYKADDTPINLLQDTDMEYGSNAYGEYYKFPNGLMICIGNIDKTYNISNGGSNGWYFDDDYGVQFPHSFIDTNYTCTVTVKTSSSLIVPYYVRNDSISKAFFGVVAPTPLSNAQGSVSYTAIGRWK